MLRRPGGLRARRPRHPLDRSLLRRLLALSCARAEAQAGTPAEDHRQRAALLDGRADAARAAERSPLPALLRGGGSAISSRRFRASRATTSAAEGSRPSWSRSGARSPTSCPASTTRSATWTRRRFPVGRACRRPNRSELAPWCGFGYSRRSLALLLGHAARPLVRPRWLHPRLRPRPRQRARARGALELLERQPPVGQLVIADKGFAGADFERAVARARRAARASQPKPTSQTGRRPRSGGSASASSRSSTRSKSSSGSNDHLAKTPDGLICRVAATHPRPHRRHPPQLAARPAAPCADRLRALIDQPSRGSM